jgi:hypothetical protein
VAVAQDLLAWRYPLLSLCAIISLSLLSFYGTAWQYIFVIAGLIAASGAASDSNATIIPPEDEFDPLDDSTEQFRKVIAALETSNVIALNHILPSLC